MEKTPGRNEKSEHARLQILQIRMSAQQLGFIMNCQGSVCKKIICLSTEHQGILKNSFQKCLCIPGSYWNLEMLVFKERGQEKAEYPERKKNFWDL